MDAHKKYFTKQLNEWHSNVNQRSLPWKEEKDPYKIWLSEIILQQTRAEQGLKYYVNFTETYPSVWSLANAKDEDVFRLWQGLGYYNRCKNMLATARFVCAKLNGKFPGKYEDIIALKGIGAYTAAAIASFAFNLPHAVVDGNVYRVLSRYFGIETAIDSTEGKRLFASYAQELLNHKNPAAHNQAIMDLGATVCTPRQVKCTECPLIKKCIAYSDDLISLLPVKSKKLKVQNRFFNFMVLQCKDEIWIERRTEKGIWQNLHQFYLIETDAVIDEKEMSTLPQIMALHKDVSGIQFSAQLKQRLTHQLIDSKFYSVSLKSKPRSLPDSGFWIPLKDLDNYAFPKTLVDFLENALAQ
ncbi:MAG: A/G-specific adenine glycosylase [Bacteroidota bacterium]